MNTREKINAYMDLYPEFETLIDQIIEIKNGNNTFRDLLTFAGFNDDQANKVDSAYPCDYAKSIRELYPDFKNGINCYNYNDDHFGQMFNISNPIVKKILSNF